MANIGINMKKNVWLDIYALNWIKVKILIILNHSSGINIKSISNKVIIEIVLLIALFSVMLFGLNLTLSCNPPKLFP